MKRLRVAAGATIGLVLGLAVVTAPSASASAALTIYGPTSAVLNSTVTVGGHTALPGQAVTLHYRVLDYGNSASYSHAATVHSGGNLAYTVHLPVPLSADYSYYASSGAVRTQVHVVRVARTTCTASGPAFTKLPVSAQFGPPAFGAFTATRGSVWSGVAVGGATFAVLRWSAQNGLVDLANFNYQSATGAGYAPSAPGSVNVVGITPYGSVVAAVQDPTSRSAAAIGYVWTPDGTRHRLRAQAAWDSVRPVGVADDGRIFGVTEDLGHGAADTTQLVTWAGAYANPVVLTTLHQVNAEAFVDHAGDLIYTFKNGTAHVRLASGQVRALQSPTDQYVYAQAAAGHTVYGAADDGSIVRWNLASVPPSGPLTGVRLVSVNGNIDGAGRDGDVALDNGAGEDQPFVPHHVITAAGHYGDVPARDQRDTTQAVDYRGTVAYTSATDHLPHFLRCS